jgi:glycine/serine hydroxymethyltransferase
MVQGSPLWWQADELIDIPQVREQAIQHRPKLIIAGGSAYPREIAIFRHFGRLLTKWARI